MNGRLLSMRVRVEGLGLEKLLNRLLEENIAVTRVGRRGLRAMTLSCAAADYPRLKQFALDRGFRVTELADSAPVRLGQLLRGRWGLLAGGALFLSLLTVSLQFVWRVRVVDAGMYLGEIQTVLREEGVAPGVWKGALSTGELRDALEWRLPKVAWVQVRLRGVTLEIKPVLGTPAPEVETQGRPGDIVAAEDGVIIRLSTLAGTPVCKAGDVVRKGQVLIRGEERAGGETVASVKARGEAIARVWDSASVRVPAYETLSEPTGKTSTRQVVRTPFFALESAPEPDFLTRDIEKTVWPVGGAWLPVWLERETHIEVALRSAPRDEESLRAEAGEAAMRLLRAKNSRDDEMVDKWIDYSMIQEGYFVATATAEYARDIAAFQPYPHSE